MTEQIKGGYILLARNMIESEIWQKPPAYLKIWIYILFRVNWKKSKHNEIGMDLFNFTQEKIPGVKQTQIYDFLRWAKTLNSSDQTTQITTQKTTRGIRLKVNKYEYYQDPKNYQFQNTFQDTFQHKSKTIPKTLINSINTSINISSSSSIEEFEKFYKNLEEEEEETLKIFSKKEKIKCFRPWLRKIYNNGDYEEVKKQAYEYKYRLEAAQKIKEEQKLKLEQQKQQERELTEEERKIFLQKAREKAGINKLRRAKK